MPAHEYEAVKRLVAAISALRETFDHHSPGVAILAEKLADVAGLPAAQIELVSVGAHLHDVGKVMISRDLLNATRKFTDTELVEMRRHSDFGWVIVEQAGFEEVICEIVRHHHERYDGNGYPDQLAMQQIPLGARIVSVCDVYHALTHDRSYRRAFSPPLTLNYMQSEAGKKFDPHLLDLFSTRVLREKP